MTGAGESPEQHADELERIKRAYRERDASGSSVYTFDNPAFVFHTHELEWQLLAALRRAGTSLRGARVLEVGCGFGAIVSRLHDFGAAEAVGVDLAEHRIQQARERYPAVEFMVADGAALPFDDASFDFVTQFVCLSSVLDPAVRRSIGAEMWRVLRPGGFAVSYDIRPLPAARRLVRRLAERRRGAAAGGTPTVGISAAEIRAILPGDGELTTMTLEFTRAGIAGRSLLAVQLLGRVPILRTHHLFVAHKAVE